MQTHAIPDLARRFLVATAAPHLQPLYRRERDGCRALLRRWRE